MQTLTVSLVIEYIFLVIAGILPIANPLSTAPIFATMSRTMSKDERQGLARRTCLYMAAILVAFLLGGLAVLQLFGVSLGGLQVAGGLVILYIGFPMLFPPPAHEGQAAQSMASSSNPALIPLAMPMLSGPGAIAVVIGMASRVDAAPTMERRLLGYLVVIAGILVSAFVCWLVLRASTTVVARVGESRIDAVTRLMGFLLICVGVEFIRNGVVRFIAVSGTG